MSAASYLSCVKNQVSPMVVLTVGEIFCQCSVCVIKLTLIYEDICDIMSLERFYREMVPVYVTDVTISDKVLATV